MPDLTTVFMIVVLVGAVYFMMIKPQQKRAKEQKDLMNNLAEGSRVMTISGIIGTIKHLGEKQAVLEISPGVEMTIDKRAISPQPVVDEFEYADTDGEDSEVLDAEIVDADSAESVADNEPEQAASTDNN